jgi:hypothetical protein
MASRVTFETCVAIEAVSTEKVHRVGLECGSRLYLNDVCRSDSQLQQIKQHQVQLRR